MNTVDIRKYQIEEFVKVWKEMKINTLDELIEFFKDLKDNDVVISYENIDKTEEK